MMTKETWKEIKGYEGCYSVSNLGHIKSHERTVNNGSNSGRIVSERMLKQSIHEHGYLTVGLSMDSKVKMVLVHRVVAEAFIENINNKMFINHKNGIKTDNNVDNLEWCTRSENMQHAHDNGLLDQVRGSGVWNSKLTEKQVAEIKKQLMIGVRNRDLAAKYNISEDVVSSIRMETKWKHVKVDGYKKVKGNTKGENNPKAKFTANNIRDIRKHISDGLSDVEIAQLYNRPKVTINHIRHKRTWGHVV